jgi:hypothetical protein
MAATITLAPIFFTLSAQIYYKFFLPTNIAQNFKVTDGGDTVCSEHELRHYVSIFDPPPGSGYVKDPIKIRTAGLFFEPVASHLCVTYTEKTVFTRYVSLFRFTARC